VKRSEGNLSMFDGSTLLITRAGSKLDALTADDLVAGALGDPMPGASSDLGVHRAMYAAAAGPGAIAHCHPPGTVPADGGGPGKHGTYAFGDTLGDAAAECVRRARAG
jgi:ribulose-5-phosphate 4-epimerase/fuculose-1-phosphate aldolase